MVPLSRTGLLALVATMSVPVAVAGVAWACGPSGYGVPEKPAAPPSSTAAPAPQQTVTPPPQQVAPAPTPVTPSSRPTPSAGENSSATTRGVNADTLRGGGGGSGSGGGGSDSGGSGSLAGQSDPAGGSSGPAAINARVDGATAGVVEQGSQSVFASSTAPKRKAAAGSVSATEDLWSAAPSAGGKASLASAAEMGDDGGGLSTAVLAGIIVLSLGLVGIVGGLLAAEVRRRRAEGPTAR